MKGRGREGGARGTRTDLVVVEMEPHHRAEVHAEERSKDGADQTDELRNWGLVSGQPT